MVELVGFPDAEVLVVSWLTSHLAERDDAAAVATTVDADRPGRLVKVTRTGGVQRDLVTDLPQITCECWDDQEQDAADLARLVRALLAGLEQVWVGDAWVRSSTEVGGPAWLPDPETNTPRYVMTVALNVRGQTL